MACLIPINKIKGYKEIFFKFQIERKSFERETLFVRFMTLIAHISLNNCIIYCIHISDFFL